MWTKGKRKYRCQECGHEQYLHWTERDRRSRPRCMGCGSARLDPASQGAKEDEAIGRLNVAEHSESRGDLLRARS